LKVSSGVAEIAAELHSVAIALLRDARREDARLGLTSARLSALSVLAFGGDATLGELAGAEQVSLPTMTRIAAALVAAGLARRSIDPADRRFVRLQITAKGRAFDAARPGPTRCAAASAPTRPWRRRSRGLPSRTHDLTRDPVICASTVCAKIERGIVVALTFIDECGSIEKCRCKGVVRKRLSTIAI